MALTLLATNNAESALASAISATDTSLIVSAGTGAEFPDAVDGVSYFKLTIIDAATGAQTEIVNVTAKAGDIFTIERAQEGTLARAWSANDFVANMMTADTLNVIADYTKQAGESASQAGEYADNASEYAENKFTFYKTSSDPDGTIAGLAATTTGQSFRVAQGPAGTTAFKTYENQDGVAVLQAAQPGTAAVTGTVREYSTLTLAQNDVTAGNILDGAKCWVTNPADSTLADEYINNSGVLSSTGRTIPSKDVVDAINVRTDGLRTSAESQNPFEILDNKGKGAFFLGDNGRTNMPGGASTTDLDAKDVSTPKLTASSIDGDLYDVAEIDQNGRVFFATDIARGIKVYLGEPLHNHRGPLPGDYSAAGDSITAYGIAHSGVNAEGTSYSPCVRDQSWHAWASIFTNGRLTLTGVYATGGYTVTEVLRDHIPQAIANGSTFCIVMCGRNDIVLSVDIDNVTIPAFITIFRKLRQAGIIPVVCTMSAQSNTGADSRRVAELKLNAWLRAYARKYSLPLVDLHRYTVNPLTGNWTPGYNQDVSHPNGTGAKVMGQALADGLKEWTAPVFTARADEQIAAGLSQNLITNALFLTNDGTNPTDWTVTTAGTASITTDSAVKGNVWNITNQAAEIAVAVTAGQTIQLGFFVKTGSALFECYALAGGSSSTTYLAGIRDWKTAIDSFGYFSYEFIVPAGTTTATLKINAGASQCSVAQMSLIKITEI